MSDGITFDTSDLGRLAADLGHAGVSAVKAVRPVVEKGALNVKNEWRDNARATAGAHAKRYPDSISYTIRGLSAEVGPDKDKPQGALGNLLEYGSAKNPPHWDGQRAADAEAPRFEKAVLDAVDGLL